MLTVGEDFNKKVVESERVVYTPSVFARTHLLHLQEIGGLRALKRHVSRREGLRSYLFILVTDGEGCVDYEGVQHKVKAGDCVFLNCEKAYAHETSEKLWQLKWVHFDGPQMQAVYEKYKEWGGKTCFSPEQTSRFEYVWSKIFEDARSDDSIRDMRINEGLSELLTLLIEESRLLEDTQSIGKRKDLVAIRDYLQERYADKISLDELSEKFYINKFYLTRIFKENYGVSVNRYLLEWRITKAKQLLRFSEDTVENIGWRCGLGAPQYFARIFKKEEGISPLQFRQKWQRKD